jgi:hypothetical protein
MTKILSISIPQTDDDQELLAVIATLLATHGYQQLDMTIEYESNNIRYRFERDED